MQDHKCAQTPAECALRALGHPLTVMCVVLLLLNDRVLRVQWPSWVTGKLGDVAWLAFAPLVVALPLAILRPRQAPARSQHAWNRVTIGVAMLLVGAVFAVIKGLPAATAGFVEIFRILFGWTPRIVCDPTDLLTLPAMGIAYLIWMRAGAERHADAPHTRNRSQTPPTASLTRRGWAVLALAALTTLGNSGPPDEGIVCLQLDGDRILAAPQHGFAFTDTFASDDGGLTWTVIREDHFSAPDVICDIRTSAWTLTGTAGEIYRIIPGRRIERSDDGGTRWVTDMPLAGQDARLTYYQRTRSNYGAAAGPHDALIDPATGNLIVAMGLEGVLVRTAEPSVTQTSGSDAWTWIDVGPYRFEPVTGIAQLMTILQGEFGLAIAAGLITVAMVGWRAFRWPLRTLSVLAALGITITQLAFQPATATNYDIIIAIIAVLVSLGVALIVGVVAAVLQVRRTRASAWRLAGLWLGISLFYLAPFVLWGLGRIATYVAAAWIAAIVTIVVWIAAASGAASRQTANREQ